MHEVDSDVKRKPVFAQPRLAGEFFKSGCSVSPAQPRYRQPVPRYTRFHAKPHSSEVQAVLFNRDLNRDKETIKARDKARAMPMPTTQGA